MSYHVKTASAGDTRRRPAAGAAATSDRPRFHLSTHNQQTHLSTRQIKKSPTNLLDIRIQPLTPFLSGHPPRKKQAWYSDKLCWQSVSQFSYYITTFSSDDCIVWYHCLVSIIWHESNNHYRLSFSSPHMCSTYTRLNIKYHPCAGPLTRHTVNMSSGKLDFFQVDWLVQVTYVELKQTKLNTPTNFRILGMRTKPPYF